MLVTSDLPLRKHCACAQATARFIGNGKACLSDNQDAFAADTYSLSSMSLTTVASCLSENGFGRKPNLASDGRFFANASSA